MDIRKYLGKRTQKEQSDKSSVEQSDKSSVEESDTEESLCRADKSKTFMTCPSLINYLDNRGRNVTRIIYKKVWEKFILGFSVKILKLACSVLFVRNREGHLQVKKVGGQQGELLTGTMPQNHWNSILI